jgi:hypothetical protein
MLNPQQFYETLNKFEKWLDNYYNEDYKIPNINPEDLEVIIRSMRKARLLDFNIKNKTSFSTHLR